MYIAGVIFCNTVQLLYIGLHFGEHCMSELY